MKYGAAFWGTELALTQKLFALDTSNQRIFTLTHFGNKCHFL